MARGIILLAVLLIILIPILHASNNITVTNITVTTTYTAITVTNTTYWDTVTYYPPDSNPITFHSNVVGGSIPLNPTMLIPLGATPYYYQTLTELIILPLRFQPYFSPGNPFNPVSLFEQAGSIWGIGEIMYGTWQFLGETTPDNITISLPIPISGGFVELTNNKSYFISSNALLGNGTNTTLATFNPSYLFTGSNGLYVANSIAGNQYYGFFNIKWINNSIAIINRLNGSEIIFTPPPHTQANPVMFIPGRAS